jgi:hypothetical protein
VVGSVLTPRELATPTMEAEGMTPQISLPASASPKPTLPIFWAASPLPFPRASPYPRPTTESHSDCPEGAPNH